MLRDRTIDLYPARVQVFRAASADGARTAGRLGWSDGASPARRAGRRDGRDRRPLRRAAAARRERRTRAEIVERLGLRERAGRALGRARPPTCSSTWSRRSTAARASTDARARSATAPTASCSTRCARGVDAVMVGAGTVRTERYGRIVADGARQARAPERGLSAEPLACIVSGRLSLPLDTPLLGEPEARVVIVTASAASLPETAAQVRVRARRARRRARPGAGAARAARALRRATRCCARADRT